MKHLVESQQFDRESLKKLFELADALEKKRDNSLKGKILASLFYEPSTRTRFSFEAAMLNLGGSVISTENAKEFSSASKGESLEDSIRVVNQYADVIVLRHPEAGASARAAAVSDIPVINAGDGAGQHPTQGLLDLYTVIRELGRVRGLHIAAVGDLKNGRTIRSFAYLLGKYRGVTLTFVSPPELKVGDDIKEYLTRHNVAFSETQDLEKVMKEADVVYQTRVQKERFADVAEFERLRNSFIITRKMADSMKEGAIIMHPLPRNEEIAKDVDSSPHAMYFSQARYGFFIRMALLKMMLKGGMQFNGEEESEDDEEE